MRCQASVVIITNENPCWHLLRDLTVIVTFKKYHTSAVALNVIKLLLILCNSSINETLILSNLCFKFGQLDFFSPPMKMFPNEANASSFVCVAYVQRMLCNDTSPVYSTPGFSVLALGDPGARESINALNFKTSNSRCPLAQTEHLWGWQRMEEYWEMFNVMQISCKKMPVMQVVMNVTTYEHFKIRLYCSFWRI